DGWIRLRGSTYGLSVDETPDPNEFRGWAWGGDVEGNYGEAVVGWISFNCKDREVSTGLMCGDAGLPNYKVITSFQSNTNPYIESLDIGTINSCYQSGKMYVPINWTYKDDDGDNQTAFDIQVDINDGNGWQSLGTDLPIEQSVVVDGQGSSGIGVITGSYDLDKFEVPYSVSGGSYQFQVKVYNENGSSDWAQNSFSVPEHASPYPKFTPVPDKADIDELITFDDQSTCYIDISSDEKCNELGSNITYSWDFDDGTIEGTKPDPGDPSAEPPIPPIIVEHFYSEIKDGGYTIELTITDSSLGLDNRSCSTIRTVNVTDIIIPKWKEISPF
ncbi:MAG: PKD domain-containing protein, partial [Patescibacteria group bacterium]